MSENTYRTRQLCTRPLPVIKPHIRKTANIGHNIQAKVDYKAPDSARNQFKFQVGKSCKNIIQITTTIVIKNANESNMCTWSNIPNESSHKNTMISHFIISGLTVEIMASTYITNDGITIILYLQRASLISQIYCEAL